MLQLIRSVFDFGLQNRLCVDNPARYILLEDYAKRCDLSSKTNEERSFSEEDLLKLKEYALKHKDNPHAVTMLVAMETGMRIGELAALRKCDVGDEYIHVHRQQTKIPKSEYSAQQYFTDVEYTKNERQSPRGGRPLPITPECREALSIAYLLPGDSEYVFHHPSGAPIQKDSYGRYLKRVCDRLGIKVTHNHAFRVAFNARLIELGVDGNERCLVLGHSMQTNERHYSFSDTRTAEAVKHKLCAGL